MGKPSFSVGRNMDHPHLKGRFTLRLWIPSEQTPQLSARGYQSLHGIRRKAHVKSIECSAATDDSTLWSPVVITGDPTCAFRAYQALSKIVDEIDSSAIAEFPLHPRRHPILVGPGGSTLKRISADNSVRIFVPDNSQTQNGSKSDRNIIQLEGDVEPIFSSLAMIIEAVYGFRATTLVASGPGATLDSSSIAPSSTVSPSPPVPSRTSSSPSANATVAAGGGGGGAPPVATHVGNPSPRQQPGQQPDHVHGGKRTEAGGTGAPGAEQLQSKPPATWASSNAQSPNVQPAGARNGQGSQQTHAALSKPSSSVPTTQGSERATTGDGESKNGSTAGTSNAAGGRSGGGPPTPQRQHQPRSAADKARGQRPAQGQQQGQRRIEAEAGTGPSRGPQRPPQHRHGTPSAAAAAAAGAGASADAGSTAGGRAHVAAGRQNTNAKGGDLKDRAQPLAPTQASAEVEAETRTHGHPRDARGGVHQQVTTKDQTPPGPPVSQTRDRQPQPLPPPPKQQAQAQQQQQDRQEVQAKGSATTHPPGPASGGEPTHDQGCNQACSPVHTSGSHDAQDTQQPSHASHGATPSKPEKTPSLPRGPQVQQPNPPVAPTASPSPTSPQAPRTPGTAEDSAKPLPSESRAPPAHGPRAQGSGYEHDASAGGTTEAAGTAQGSSADASVQEWSSTAPLTSELKVDVKSRRYEGSQGSQESSGKPRNIRGRGQVNTQLGPGGMIQPLPGPLPSAERSKETVRVPASVVPLLQGQSKRAVPVRELPKRPILKDIQKYTGTSAVVTELASSKDGAEGSSSSGVVEEEGPTEGNTARSPPRGKEGATEVNGAAQYVSICIEGPTNCVEVATEALRMLGRGDSVRNALNFLKRTSPQRRLAQLRRQEQEDRQNHASAPRRVDPGKPEGKPEAGAEIKEGDAGPEKAAAVDQAVSTQGASTETERPGVAAASKRDAPTQQGRAGRQGKENAHLARQEKNDGTATSRETGQAAGGGHRYPPRDGFKRPYRGGGGRGGSQRTPRSQREGGAVGGRGGESSGGGENGWGERGREGSSGGWREAESRGGTDTGGQNNGWGDPDPVESPGGWGTPQAKHENAGSTSRGKNGWGKPGPVDATGGGWDKPETSSGAGTGASGSGWGEPGEGESGSGWSGSKPQSGAGGRGGGRSRTGAQQNGWGRSESGNSSTRNGGWPNGWGEPRRAEASSGGWDQSQSKSGTDNAAQENGWGEPESAESTGGWGKPEANAGGTGNGSHQNGWGEPGAVESTGGRNDSRSKGAEPPSRGARVEGDKSTEQTTRGPPPGRPYKPRRSGPSRSSRPGGPPGGGGRGSNGGRGRGGVLDGGRSGGRGDGDAGRGGGGRGQGDGSKSRDRGGDAEGGARSSERRAGSGPRAAGGGRGGRSGVGRETSGNGRGGGRGSAATGGGSAGHGGN